MRSLSSKLVGVVLFSVIWVCNGETRAVDFELKWGRQFELCRDMAAYLKAFPELLRHPFDMPFTSPSKMFRWIKWRPIDPLNHIEVVRQIAVYQNDIVWSKSPEEREARLQSNMSALMNNVRAGEVYLERARFDSNHDGEPETVYRISQNAYRWPATYDPRGWTLAWNLVVMPEDDPAASRHLSPYAKRPLQPFNYSGRIFYWNASHPLVYEPVVGRDGKDFVLLSVCEFKPSEG